MTWLVLLFIAAFAILYYTERRRLRTFMERALEYHFEFSTEEVFEGELLYLDQVVVNTTDQTIPFLKTETLLPPGLKIVLGREEGSDTLAQSVQSVFLLKPHSSVSRRWRIRTETRGLYTAAQVQMHAITNDALGQEANTRRLCPVPSAHDRVLVLPCAREWLTHMALSPTFLGEQTVPRGLIRDPMVICGIRDWESRDPLNTVDWKQTARLGRMVVREQEYQQNDSYNIVLNMQSVLIEPNPPTISAPHYIEDCISVCASLLDSAVRRDIPVSLIANTDPEGLPGGRLRDDTVGERLYCSEEFRRADQIMQALRALALLPMTMSVPVERMLDDIVRNPHSYARGGHILLVTTYLNERMLSFHRALHEEGIRVIFYIVGSGLNASIIPSDVEAYYKVSEWKGGSWYAS